MNYTKQKDIYKYFSIKFLIGMGLFFILTLLVLTSFYVYFSWQVQQPFFGISQKQIFIVTKGDSVKIIAYNLKKQSLISNDFLFIFNIFTQKLSTKLQAGKYIFIPGMSIDEISSMIKNGDVFRDIITVTIPEGFRLTQIEKRLKLMGLLENETKNIYDFTTGNFSNVYPFLLDAPQEATLEGYLFPDTYYFERTISLDEIIRRMLDNFDTKFDAALHTKAIEQNKNIFDIIIMASLIQNEVITKKDMELVSGLLQKRIEIGMPLQVDATVVYITKKRKLSYDDLKINSLYNTYKYKGLPKGPISSPGYQAIYATLHPIASNYLFYLSKPNGETVFSSTLGEHNAAKRRYLK